MIESRGLIKKDIYIGQLMQSKTEKSGLTKKHICMDLLSQSHFPFYFPYATFWQPSDERENLN